MLVVIVDPRVTDRFWSGLCNSLRNHVLESISSASQRYSLVEMVPTEIVNGVSTIRKVDWSEPVHIELARDSIVGSNPYRFHLGKNLGPGIRCLVVIAGEIDHSAFETQIGRLEDYQSDFLILNFAREQVSSRGIIQVGRILDLYDPSSFDEAVGAVELWLKKGDPNTAATPAISEWDSASQNEGSPIVSTTEETSVTKATLTTRATKPLKRRGPGAAAEEDSSFLNRSQSLDQVPSTSIEKLEDSEPGSFRKLKRRWLQFKKNRKENKTKKGKWRGAKPVSRNLRSERFRSTRGRSLFEAFNENATSEPSTLKRASEPRSANGNIIVQSPSTLSSRPWYSPDWIKLADIGPGRDLEVEYGGATDLRIMAGSARGTRHQYYGEPNQDAFAIAQNEHFVILVVSDGVGAAKFAAYGSKVMSHAIARQLSRQLGATFISELKGIRQAIVEAMQQASDSVQSWEHDSLYSPNDYPNEVERRELSATITVCVIPIVASDSGSRHVVCGYVGDSPCYTLGESGWTLRSKPTKDGEILDLATSALPSAIGELVVPDFVEFDLGFGDSLFLMTDGIGTSLGSGQTQVGRWLGDRLRNPVLAAEWIDALTFDRQGEDDDRTLIMLYDYVGVTERVKSETEGLTPTDARSITRVSPE